MCGGLSRDNFGDEDEWPEAGLDQAPLPWTASFIFYIFPYYSHLSEPDQIEQDDFRRPIISTFSPVPK